MLYNNNNISLLYSAPIHWYNDVPKALYRYIITPVIGFRLTCTQCMHIFHSLVSIPASHHFTSAHFLIQPKNKGQLQQLKLLPGNLTLKAIVLMVCWWILISRNESGELRFLFPWTSDGMVVESTAQQAVDGRFQAFYDSFSITKSSMRFSSTRWKPNISLQQQWRMVS